MRELKRYPLSNEEIATLAPAVTATMPHDDVSGRYSFVPTTDVIDIMRGEGWLPVHAKQARANKEHRSGFQKHIVRFRHHDLMDQAEAIEAVLVNSHDGTTSFKFMAGIYRLVCSNGLVVGETFEEVRVRHVNFDPQGVIDASKDIIEYAPKVAGAIGDMKAIELSPDERGVYAMAAQQLLYGDPEKESPVTHNALLEPRRSADYGTDLWTTYNVVQENMINGGLRGTSPKTKKRSTTRAVTAIDKSVAINRALFTLADEMRKLKVG